MKRYKKDLKNRTISKKDLIHNVVQKVLLNNKILPFEQRSTLLANTGKASPFLTRARDYCKYSGKARGVFSKYGIARYPFKLLADSGLLAGVRRSSW